MEKIKLEAGKRYVRSFVGVPLPEQFREEFGRLLTDLVKIDPDLRLVDERTPHVLLDFLGNQIGSDLLLLAKDIEEKVKTFFGLKLRVGGAGSFRNGQRLVVFLKAKGLPGKLQPHLTVARKKERQLSTEIIERLNQVDWEFIVEQICIYGAKSTEVDIRQEKLICFNYDH